MEKEPIGFIETCLRILNNDLKHFKLCFALVFTPILVVFILVMWVIEPTYRATAIVTPPASSANSLGRLSAMLGGNMSGMGGLLGLSTSDENSNAMWVIFNSWELHNQVIEEFNLREHYKFDGNFQADLLKKFRKNFGLEFNDEDMLAITIEDKDFRLAAQMVSFMLAKADSAFNAFKTTQARQSREYLDLRLDSCEKILDSLLQGFVKFQVENNFYEPTIQMESTIKYLGELQAKREEIAIEMSYEKADRGESKRYDQLQKRLQGVNVALNGVANGKNGNIGMVALKKSPQLAKEFMEWEAQIKIQEVLYKVLRQQSEEVRLEEAKMLTNLHVLEPPWPNDKKVAPLRGVSLMFTAFVAFLFATILCNFIEFIRSESSRGSEVSKEWATFKGFFGRSSKR